VCNLINRLFYLFLITAQIFFVSQQTLAQQSGKEVKNPSVSGKSSPINNSDFPGDRKPRTAKRTDMDDKFLYSRIYEYIKPSPEREIRLPKLSASAKKQASDGKREQIGAIRKLRKTLSKVAEGTTFSIKEGEVWIIKITSESAIQTRLHFNKINLPEGVKVFVYSAKNPDVFFVYEQTGATETSEFWTPPVEGESVVVEYFVPKSNKLRSGKLPFQIDRISHIFGNLLN
jgi:hypothetical protein